eukprot:20832-Heterococcus_DN1.PRE.1
MGVSASKRTPLLSPGANQRGGFKGPSTVRSNSIDQYHRWLYCQSAAAPAAAAGADCCYANSCTPSARSGHTVCNVGRKALLFGGCGRADGREDKCLNDLFAFDVETLRWERIGQYLCTIAASLVLCCTISDSVPSRAALCWAVKQYSITVFTKHTGIADICSHYKLCIVSCAEVRGDVMPAVRRSAAMCSLGDGRFILSGGAGDDPDHLRSDMYQFDTTTKQWTKLLESVSQWQGKLLYFGGSTGLEYSNELHQYDVSTNRWQKLVTTGTPPSPRYKHQAIIHNGALYIIGGGSFKPQCDSIDVYKLDLTTMHWKTVRTHGDTPAAR